MDKKKEIRKMVKDICEKQGKMQWEMHIMPVLNNALKLADLLKADKEILETAAYLHDIARISGKEGDHHIKGAEMAREILTKVGYEKPFIEKVSYCIQNHGSAFKECKTLESKILNSADAMAHIESVAWLIWLITASDKMSLKDAFEWVDKKVDKGWNKKIQLPEAREMARPKYEAAKIILDSTRKYLYVKGD